MMLAVGVAILLIVLVALFGALRDSSFRKWIAQPRTVMIGGVLFPVVVLSISLVYGLWTTARVVEAPPAGELRVQVIGEMWWWRVIYFDGDEPAFETANEIRIPVGTPVTFELQSMDVIHSFWVPELAPKLDMIPGRVNLVRAQADAPGIYRGFCTEYCGAAHALMAFEVIAMTEADFNQWRADFVVPVSPGASRSEGERLFREVGCAVCHSVQVGDFVSHVGPDLTHVADRRTLGAGILPNTPVTLRAWISHAAELKPGVRMPSYEQLTEEEIDAIALYLESLT